MTATVELLERTGIGPLPFALEEQLSQEKIEAIQTDRDLAEVDYLANNRLPDGSFPGKVLEDGMQNKKTGVQEGGIIQAVSKTEHEYINLGERGAVIMSMGKTAVETAINGGEFYISDAAKARLDVEVDEARHNQEDLMPGVKKAFISPKMTRQDADIKTAKRDNLATEDAVRVSWLETDGEGNIKKRITHSLLARDIPIAAWNAMLEDPDNIFGKSIDLEDPESALSVMKAHRELEVPEAELEDGPVGIIKAVLTYIEDPEARQSVLKQIRMFEGDQDEIDRVSESIAQRLMKFDADLEESLRHERASDELGKFIDSLKDHWIDEHLEIINDHSDDNGYAMSRKLASILVKAKKNLMWSSAGVVTDNEEIIQQIDPELVDTIKNNEMELQAAWQQGEQAYYSESAQNQLIARQAIKAGGGCGGGSGKFKKPWEEGYEEDQEGLADHNWKKNPKSWKSGVCRYLSKVLKKAIRHSSKIGPCDICTICQVKFDRGQNPD